MDQERLSKIMAARGLCSRREADKYIERGHVSVNGIIVNKLGSKVSPNDKIVLSKQAKEEQKKLVTFILNKPIGYVSSQPEKDYKPAVSLINYSNQWSRDSFIAKDLKNQLRGVATAGRLDIDSHGLLVLTQDGRISRRIIGENTSIEKEYIVRIEGKLNSTGLKKLNYGLELDGKPLKPAKVNWFKNDYLCFILKEGKKRQIRRMCELVGVKVTNLKRVRVGNVLLGNLPKGQWRYLGDNESF